MRRAAVDLAIAICALLGAAPALDAHAQPDSLRAIDELASRWTGLEHQKDLLEADWRMQKPVLEQQLSLLEREAAELNALLATSERQQDEVEQRRLELLEEQTRLEQEQDALERSLARSALALRSLHPALPPPLLEAWNDALPRLDDPLRTATEKLQLVLELLTQLDDFDRKVTLHETVLTLGDGRDYAVKQVYLGLSHGWYVTADRRLAGAGRADPSGWRWTPVADGEPVGRIVDILERRADPALVSIPLELHAPAAGAD